MKANLNNMLPFMDKKGQILQNSGWGLVTKSDYLMSGPYWGDIWHNLQNSILINTMLMSAQSETTRKTHEASIPWFSSSTVQAAYQLGQEDENMQLTSDVVCLP